MKWNIGRLAKDTSIMTLGMGLRAFSQGLVFIIIARVMGTNGYGSFVAIIAISGALSGLVGFGSQVLLTRDIALDPQKFCKAWGHTLITLAISFPTVFFFYVVLAWLTLPTDVDWVIILLIGIADLLFWPLSHICISAYQGFERIGRASRMILAPALTRLVAAFVFLHLLFVTSIDSVIVTWSILYLCAAAIATAYTHWMVYQDIGKPIFFGSFSARKITESIPFSFLAISDKLYADADKIILARMTTLDTTGVYSAAYSFIELGLIPLYGLIGAATPRFFKEGKKGIKSSISYSIQLINVPLFIAIGLSIIIYFLADLAPYILGKEYITSIQVIQMLAFMPLIILPRILMQSILATAGLQKNVMIIIFSGSAINIICNLIMIPLWGWHGAVIATYIAEISMSLSMIFILNLQLKKQII